MKKVNWESSRIRKFFFGSIIGLIITVVFAVTFDIVPFKSRFLNTYWIGILWIGVLYSVLLTIKWFPNSKWSKWWDNKN